MTQPEDKKRDEPIINAFPVRVGDMFQVQEHHGTHNVALALCYYHDTAARIIAALRGALPDSVTINAAPGNGGQSTAASLSQESPADGRCPVAAPSELCCRQFMGCKRDCVNAIPAPSEGPTPRQSWERIDAELVSSAPWSTTGASIRQLLIDIKNHPCFIDEMDQGMYDPRIGDIIDRIEAALSATQTRCTFCGKPFSEPSGAPTHPQGCKDDHAPIDTRGAVE